MTNTPTSIRLFVLCAGMKWAHLPVPGGIYDQHPQLLDEWQVMFRAQGEQQERQRKKQEAEAKRKKR